MERDGADLIDIGAESTRPGSLDINAEEEWSRLAPALAALRTRLKIPISIDTRKSEIAAKSIESGAEMINDVSGLKHDPRIAEISARVRVPLILMHMRGEPQTMQQKPFARDALKDVSQGLRASLSIARKAGVANSQIVLDPGIGFGKSYAQNYELLAELPQLAKLGFPLLVGTSRKGFISKTPGPTPSSVDRRNRQESQQNQKSGAPLPGHRQHLARRPHRPRTRRSPDGKRRPHR